MTGFCSLTGPPGSSFILCQPPVRPMPGLTHAPAPLQPCVSSMNCAHKACAYLCHSSDVKYNKNKPKGNPFPSITVVYRLPPLWDVAGTAPSAWKASLPISRGRSQAPFSLWCPRYWPSPPTHTHTYTHTHTLTLQAPHCPGSICSIALTTAWGECVCVCVLTVCLPHLNGLSIRARTLFGPLLGPST